MVLIWGATGCSKPGPGASRAWWSRCAAISGLSLGLGLAACLGLRRGLRGRLEFLHIPKNAGTSVEIVGFSESINWGSFRLNLQWTQLMPDGSSCSAWHVPPALLQGPSPYLDADVFCVVRNPFDRVLSEYKYLRSVEWAALYAETYRNGLYDFPECSEEGLNHFVATTLGEYRSGRRYIDDCHHVPQAEYIWDSNGTRWCSDVLRIEDMPGAFDQLMERHGYPVRLVEQRVYDSAESCPGLTTASLTEPTKQLLREVYAEDFRRLNYSAY